MTFSTNHCLQSSTNIIYAFENFQDGGGERFLSSLIGAWKIARPNFTVAYLRKTGGDSYLQEMELTGPLVDLGLGEGHMRFRWFVVVRRILRLFETNPQIVVCIMNEWTVWFLIARLFSRNDVRIVQNMHINLSATLRSIPHWKQATMKFLNRVVLKYCDHIISVSDGVTADLVSHFKVPVTKITTILNGVRIETIQTLISAPIPDWSRVISEPSPSGTDSRRPRHGSTPWRH